MAGAAPRTRSRAPAEERRAQILVAALGCFAERGYHATTVDDLVKACGLSKGSLYWHFRSKEDVFLALFDSYAAEVFADWDAAGDAPSLEVLRRVGDTAVAVLGSQSWMLRAWAEFFAHPRARERLAAVYRLSRAKMVDSLRRDAARGLVRSDVSPEGLAGALTAALEGLLLQAMVDADFDLGEHWEATWSLVERGLSP